MTSQIMFQQMQKQILESEADIYPSASFPDLTSHLHSQNVFAFACLSSWRREIVGGVLSASSASASKPVLPQPGAKDRLESLIPQLFAPGSPVKAKSKKIVQPNKLDSLGGRFGATKKGLTDTRGSGALSELLRNDDAMLQRTTGQEKIR